MNEKSRFHDNPSGVITDTQHKKHWLPKDSWGDLGQWRNYDEALTYVQTMNQVYAGGYSDWRLPTLEEAENFFSPSMDQKDWEDEVIHINPLFVTKCSYYMWTSEVNDDGEVSRIDLRTGEFELVNRATKEHQAARLVRTI
jgi:hypothetical protein